MAFLTFTSPATDRFIGALCNTLVHSLWQGLILAAIAGLIVLLTRKSRPAIRYNLLISAMVLFAVGVGLTFALQLKQAKPLVSDAVSMITNGVTNTVVKQTNIATPAGDFTESLSSYLNQHHNTIVLIWFLIICAKSIQFTVGLLGVRRLKYTNVHQVNIEWHHRLQRLADSLYIKQRIALLESGLAKVPMVIGALKPVILIPIGLLTALSTEEVEAILIHELAHIKRRDYLVNLLQSLIEIIFFFNPAVLWISQLIRAERENCCDDLALAQSSNKVSYIRALVSCEEYQAAIPAYAMAFAGDKNTLMSRVKRMVSNRNHSLNLFEKTALAVCLVVSGLCLSAFAKKAQRAYIADTVAKVISNIQNQNINKKEKQLSINKPQQSGEQTSLLNDADKTALASEASSPDMSKYAGGASDSSKTNINLNIKLDSINIHLAPIKINTNVKLDSMKMHISPMKINLGNVNVNPKVSVNVDTPKKVQYTVESNLKYGINNGTASQSYNSRASLKYLPNTTIYGKPKYSHNEAITLDTIKPNRLNTSQKVILKRNQELDGGSLIKLVDKSIKDKNNFKIVINNKELIVDGVKQSEELHQLALKKYVKYPDDKVDFTIAVTNSN